MLLTSNSGHRYKLQNRTNYDQWLIISLIHYTQTLACYKIAQVDVTKRYIICNFILFAINYSNIF